MDFFPAMVTFLAAPSPDPVMVTDAPMAAVDGENEVMVGVRWKLVALVAVPSGVTTVTAPSDAPVGMVTVIDVTLSATTVATVPANVTEVAPLRLVPVMVTFVPAAPLTGPNEVMVGEKT